MTLPSINTRLTNVELTDERTSLITRRLLPLARLLEREGDASIDVMLHKSRSRVGGDMYFLTLKVRTNRDVFMAVASHRLLSAALKDARGTVQRAINRAARVSEYSIRRSRQDRMDMLFST